jgi:hypothetical protein
MLEFYIDDRGEAAIENIDDLLKLYPEYAKKAAESALKSEGFRLKQLIAAAIKKGGVNSSWAKLNPHTGVLSRAKKGFVKNFRLVWKGEKGSKRRARQYKQQMFSTRKNPLLKLAGAVRYKYYQDMALVSIGFFQSPGVSENMVKLAGMHAKGFETNITPHMRKMLFALGFPVKKSTTVLKTPARPVIEPVFESEKDNIMRNIEIKFFKAMDRYWNEGQKE